MYEYDEECLKVFLEKQLQLFDEPVAERKQRHFWRTAWQLSWIRWTK